MLPATSPVVLSYAAAVVSSTCKTPAMFTFSPTPIPPAVTKLPVELVVLEVSSRMDRSSPNMTFFSTARPPAVCIEASVTLDARVVDATEKSESTVPSPKRNLPLISTSPPKMALLLTVWPPSITNAADPMEVASVSSLKWTSPSMMAPWPTSIP